MMKVISKFILAFGFLIQLGGSAKAQEICSQKIFKGELFLDTYWQDDQANRQLIKLLPHDLRSLTIIGPVSDDGFLEELGRLKQLDSLNLEGTEIKDISALATLNKLICLNLHD